MMHDPFAMMQNHMQTMQQHMNEMHSHFFNRPRHANNNNRSNQPRNMFDPFQSDFGFDSGFDQMPHHRNNMFGGRDPFGHFSRW